MSMGMQVLNPDGTLAYTTDDVTWNQVDFFYQPAYTDVTNTYAVLVGRESLVSQFFIDPPPSDRRAVAHNVSVGSNGSVRVWGGSVGAYIIVMMR